LIAATSGGVWTGSGITDNITGTFNPSVAGTFTVTYTISGSCGNSDTEVVIVNSPSNSTINNVTPVCAGTAAFDLTAATAGGSWSGTGITNAANGTFDPNVSGPGTFPITYLISNGCGSSSTQNVTVNQLPTPSTTPDVSTGCAPLCVQFTGSGSALCNSVSYNFGDGITSSSSDPSHCYNAGTYSVTITCTDFNGCSGTNSIPVIINAHAVPTAAISVSPSSIVAPNTSVVFTDASTSGGNQIWNFGDPSSSNNTSFLSSDSHTYTQEGIYCISLVSINNNGCIDSTSECITVVSDAVFSVPNVFTPNGDGNNDVFFIASSGVKTLECTIYDRWGLKIAQFGALNAGWNGRTSAGAVAPDGVYYYTLVITGMNEKVTEKQGFIQLLSK
jgi:gliding motility-associated-like protein